MSLEAMKQALEALELMYACYVNPDWVSYKQQEDKILIQCLETIKSTRQAIANEALNKKAENARELGLEYQPSEPVAHQDWCIGGNKGPCNCEKQEPVAWDANDEAFDAWWDSEYNDSTNPYRKNTPAYWAWAGWKAAQPKREPLTEKQIIDLWQTSRKQNHIETFVRAIEAAHGIKGEA